VFEQNELETEENTVIKNEIKRRSYKQTNKTTQKMMRTMK
jgi:hypothetical protein